MNEFPETSRSVPIDAAVSATRPARTSRQHLPPLKRGRGRPPGRREELPAGSPPPPPVADAAPTRQISVRISQGADERLDRAVEYLNSVRSRATEFNRTNVIETAIFYYQAARASQLRNEEKVLARVRRRARKTAIAKDPLPGEGEAAVSVSESTVSESTVSEGATGEGMENGSPGS